MKAIIILILATIVGIAGILSQNLPLAMFGGVLPAALVAVVMLQS